MSVCVSFLSPRNLPIKFGTNPSTIFVVIVVTDRHTQTDRQTNAGKTYFLAFAGITILVKNEFTASLEKQIVLSSVTSDNIDDQSAGSRDSQI